MNVSSGAAEATVGARAASIKAATAMILNRYLGVFLIGRVPLSEILLLILRLDVRPGQLTPSYWFAWRHHSKEEGFGLSGVSPISRHAKPVQGRGGKKGGQGEPVDRVLATSGGRSCPHAITPEESARLEVDSYGGVDNWLRLTAMYKPARQSTPNQGLIDRDQIVVFRLDAILRLIRVLVVEDCVDDPIIAAGGLTAGLQGRQPAGLPSR